MNNPLEKYVERIKDSKNKLFKNYKGLIVSYEDSRQIYEKLIHEYENSNLSTTVTPCSQIVGYNDGRVIVRWIIESLDGTSIYESGNLDIYQTKVINISSLSLQPGTQFKVKAIAVGTDSEPTSSILEYIPSSNTAYYEMTDDLHLAYNGVVPSPLTPPVLKCATIFVNHNALVVAKYELRYANGSGTIYTSGKHNLNDKWSKNLSELNIAPGTQLKLHANVSAGDDSDAYLIIEYDPEAIYYADTANFMLVGNAFYTAVFYEGVN